MKFRLTIVAATLLCAALFVLAVLQQSLRAIVHCEGFGCMGLGILYLALAMLIVLAFMVAGAVFGPKPRWRSALFAGGSALVAILVAFGVIDQANKARDAKGFAAYQRDCDKNPKLCPGLPELLRQRQPQQ